MEIFYNSNVVVLLSFSIFVAILWKVGVHKLIGGALDARADRIRAELDEARRLREEAQSTFAEFERKQRDVASQADDIVEHAKREADQMLEKARADIKASVERRLRSAEEQIALAEQDAVKQIKDRAVATAIAVAGQLMSEKMTDDKANTLIDDAISGLGAKLH